MVVVQQRRLVTVDEYDRMAEAGILGEDDRVELIEGEIVEMVPIGSAHVGCVMRLHNRLLSLEYHHKALIGMQNPIHLNPMSEPQPDLMLLKPREDFYEQSHPTPSDVLFVVEISDSSQEYDRLMKIPLYGKASIPETWLVDVRKKIVEIYTQPSEAGYQTVQTSIPGDTISPLAFPDLTISVNDLFGIKPPSK